jgi:hypothetical protein
MSKLIRTALAGALPVVMLALPAAAMAGHVRPAGDGHAAPVVRSEPVQNIYNQPWYNYVADIQEAEKELTSDLKRASDREDRADAWEEYDVELADADKDYVKEMRERGYRVGRVSILAYND